MKATMIDTSDGATKVTRAFDTGLGSTEKRIDLSNLIDDGTQKH